MPKSMTTATIVTRSACAIVEESSPRLQNDYVSKVEWLVGGVCQALRIVEDQLAHGESYVE